MEPRSEHDDGGVYAVVVIYRRAWGDAAAMPLLRDWRDADVSDMHTPALRQLLVWDNSPEPVGPPPDDRERFEYMSDRDNGGTRAAYTEACRRAASLGVPWVLLLDQDTLPPEGFAAAVGRAIADPSNASAAALVPRVQHDGRLVSPAVILPSGRVVPRHLGAAGGGGADVPTAIASGTLIRTADLQALMPIPPEFWLDFLDHWVFRELHRRGRPIAGIDCDIAHHLSVKDPASMSELRFRNVLRAERQFMADLPTAARWAYRLRLGLRALRLAPRAPALSSLALRACLSVRG
jgi:hypothetical protein